VGAPRASIKSIHFNLLNNAPEVKTSDFLIIGSGIAGLSLALRLAEHGRVNIVTKRDPSDSNTNKAQGGIAAVMDRADSHDLHIADTIRAGDGLCRESVVDFVVKEGPDRIRDLISLGVPFSREEGELDLGLEGGHSRKRIVHCADLTGKAVEQSLLDAVSCHANIEVYRHHMAVNLIREHHLERDPDGDGAVYGAVYGVYALDEPNDKVVPFAAQRTILATGGAGKVYMYTSNPDIATGDGVAMAYRAGARIANLEFVQFHPTCLYHPELTSFLLSEALRGEGGRLVRADGSTFMETYDDRRELASRDIVARAIDNELKTSGDDCVFLDLTHLDSAFIERRFPYIFKTCFEVGIDMRTDPIPVVPATHYFCGGIDVDDYGRASVKNLFAIGEVSHTGLHGANRLASNSLLEALVYADRAGTASLEDFQAGRILGEPKTWEAEGTEELKESVILEHDWNEARRVMWDYVGIVRSDRRLKIAMRRMIQLRETVISLYWKSRLTRDLLELRNIILMGKLIIECALRRKESRGLHYTETYPHRDDENFACDTILQPEAPKTRKAGL
jgi:L-aspartate oxidase